MRLPKIALENYQFVLILVLLCIMSGIASYTTMPRSEDPVLKAPFYTLAIVYPGTSPKDMEELVVDPIEDEIDELENIDEIKTRVEEGLAIIRIEADYEEDIDDKYDEISAAVNNIRSELPSDIYSLELSKFSPLDVAIFQIALLSENLPYKELEDRADNLKDLLKQDPGVRDVEIEAFADKEVRISLDFQKMANQNISLAQVIGVLQGNNANIPGGNIKADRNSFTIKTSGGFQNLAEIRETVIGSNGSKIVYLGDIAHVHFDYADELQRWRYTAKRGIFMTVSQQEGVNILSLDKRLRAIIQDYKEELNNDLELAYSFEQAPAVRARINDFFVNLIQGILLVGAIILIFLGGRPSLIIMTIIPTSIVMAITTLDFSGLGLQQISIAGLVIALGLLVDNGIVVIENISRFLKEGHPIQKAAYLGTAEVGWALVSSTVTTLLAFFPLTQLPEGVGEFLRSLPLIVMFSLIASLLLALTFTPILARGFLRNPKVGKKPNVIARILHYFTYRVYKPTLNFSLRFPLIILGLGFGLLFIGILLFPIVGVSFFPTADKPLLLIDIDGPQGINLDETDRAVQFVENLLQKEEFVKDFNASIGKGNAYVYYNRIPKNFKKNHAQVLVNLKTWDSIRFYKLIEKLRKEFSQYPSARITVFELKNGPPFLAPIEIKILGKNLDSLKRISLDIEEIITSTEGAIDVDNPFARDKTDIKVNINKDKAGLIGLSLNEIDLAVRASLTGVLVDQVNFEDGEEYDMIVRLPFEDKISMEDFDKIYISTRSGGQVPLKQVAGLEFEAGVAKIGHYNTIRNASVTANVSNGDKTREITEAIIKKLENYKFPKGYGYYVAGEYKTQQESFGNLGQVLVVAMIAIFAVLVLQFKSFGQPFVVFSAIPLAFSGSIFALFLTGFSFSFFAFVGFISLVGIVVNNSIILVDYTNQLRSQGMKVKEAIRKSAETRFTPIVLTTLTTILGLLPLTLSGSSLWGPLGWTIIGGMISSTFLTLLVVPILYQWFTRDKKV